MILRKRNLFQPVPDRAPEEFFEELLSGKDFRLERIVSMGHRSPDGFWYDQPQAEWVLLMRGSAVLQIQGQAEPLELKPGDAVLLPAHCKHRVAATDLEGPSFWLALHHTDGDVSS